MGTMEKAYHGCLHLQEKHSEFRGLPLLELGKLGWFFVGGEMLSHPLRLLAANTASRNGLRRVVQDLHSWHTQQKMFKDFEGPEQIASPNVSMPFEVQLT